MKRAWVDFNDIERGEVVTLAGFVGDHVTAGDAVTAWDHDGTEVPGVVVSVDAELVTIALNDSGDEAEAPSPPTALSASLTEAKSSASLLPCSYCGAVTDQPCRKDCSGRYRR